MLGADAMQSPECICASHLPSAGGELLGADAMQSPQCICARHLPPQEGNCRVQTRYNHPVRLRHRVQTQCNRPSVSVLDISPHCWVQTQCNRPSCARHLPSTGGELLGADAMQSPQCICARHLPSAGGELLGADAMGLLKK